MGLRGRKKGSIGIKSRESLLEIAAEEFAAHGYHSTKISTIVQRAGFTQPTFYLYFSSKKHIYDELVVSFQKKLADLTAASRLESEMEMSSLPNQIKSSLTSILRFLSEHPHLSKIGFYDSEQSIIIKKEMVNQIRENLIFEQQNNYFSSHLNMELIAQVLVGAIERLTITKLFTNEDTPENIASEIVDFFLYGMVPRENKI